MNWNADVKLSGWSVESLKRENHACKVALKMQRVFRKRIIRNKASTIISRFIRRLAETSVEKKKKETVGDGEGDEDTENRENVGTTKTKKNKQHGSKNKSTKYLALKKTKMPLRRLCGRFAGCKSGRYENSAELEERKC